MLGFSCLSAKDAVEDLSTMLELRRSGTEFAVRLVTEPDRWTLVVYRSGTPITLSDVLPQLQHMGLEVVDEHPYQFTGGSKAASFWVSTEVRTWRTLSRKMRLSAMWRQYSRAETSVPPNAVP